MMQRNLTLPCSQMWLALPARRPRKGRASWASWAVWCSRRGCRNRRLTRWGWVLAWAVPDGRYGYASRGLRLPGVAGGSRVHVVAADLCCTQCLSWQHHIYHHPIMCAAIHVCSSRDWPSWAWASQEPLPRLWAPQALRRTLMHWQVGHRRATSVGDLSALRLQPLPQNHT